MFAHLTQHIWNNNEISVKVSEFATVKPKMMVCFETMQSKRNSAGNKHSDQSGMSPT